MDWEEHRGLQTRGYKAQVASQDPNNKRLTLKKRCASCNGRLIKQSYLLTQEQYDSLQPLVEEFYRTEQYCEDCDGQSIPEKAHRQMEDLFQGRSFTSYDGSPCL